MHIAFNAYFWNQPFTGSGQYLRQLVYHLNRLVSDLELTLVFPQLPDASAPTDVPPSVKVEIVGINAGNLAKVRWEQIDFPRACRRLGADLAHVPYWGSPLQSPVPVVVTVHDLTTHIIPEYRQSPLVRLYNGLVTASAKGASHIITDSHASKADIMTHLGISDEQITPIHLAIGSEFSPDSEFLLDMAVARKYDLPDEFILYLGGYPLHKNILTLLHAYTYVADALGDDYPLVLAGKKPDKVTPLFPDYEDYIERSNIKENVRWLGFVDEEDKPALYRLASNFVFPSRYEGFGLPPLEAMACGLPVVTTTVSSLPEVVGDAAMAVEPDNVRGFGGAMIATLIQDNLIADLRAKGLAQAKKFTWEKTATETLLIYDQVLGGLG